MVAENQNLPPQKITRTERLWITAAVIFGAVVRLSFPGRMAVEHFDEGVYASNFWFGPEQNFSYPAQHLYAPPLLPTAIEWTMTAASLIGIKPTGMIPIIPCLIAGIVMIPSIWWIVRRWFGPAAGLGAAWLVATSDFHACYSRAALTDVPVCLFMLWAVYFIERAFTAAAATVPASGGRKTAQRVPAGMVIPWKQILFAGGFTSLAWWTKYSGWLPLAIGLAGGTLWQALTPSTERRVRQVGICWLLIAAVAVMLWLPVVWGLQKFGGYETVAANHRQYLVGVSGWYSSAKRQLTTWGIYDNPLEFLYSPTIGPFDSPTESQRLADEKSHVDRQDVRLAAPTSARRFPIGSNVSVIIPLLWAGVAILSCLAGMRHQLRTRESMAIFLLAAWLGGMTVATPFYYPYPRLVLPWLIASWISIALLFRSWPITIFRASAGGFARGLPSVIPVILMLTYAIRLASGCAFAWSDRTSARETAQEFAAKIKQDSTQAGYPANEGIAYILGEPAIVFGLKAEDLPLVGPVADASFTNRAPSRPTFFVYQVDTKSWQADDQGSVLPRFEKRDSRFMHHSHLVFYDRPDSKNAAVEMRLDRQSR